MIAAESVRGTGIDRKLFNGKPVLVVYFASWGGTCRREFVQLRELLEDGWKDKVGIVAISWTERRYGHVAEERLHRMVSEFHPVIRVIRETEQINEDFAPLVYVPANFVFDKNGKLVFGDGSREYLDKERLAVLLNQAN